MTWCAKPLMVQHNLVIFLGRKKLSLEIMTWSGAVMTTPGWPWRRMEIRSCFGKAWMIESVVADWFSPPGNDCWNPEDGPTFSPGLQAHSCNSSGFDFTITRDFGISRIAMCTRRYVKFMAAAHNYSRRLEGSRRSECSLALDIQSSVLMPNP